ncbi:MAG: hypothetical protein IJ608_13510 [Lachnospiraceae bacterium]|nr:hypothetical protein [Lachnospiraceae bacterium]
MVERGDILSLGYLKKAEFTGSDSGFRYRLKKVTRDEADALECAVWDEPYNFFVTPEEQKRYGYFEFNEDGIVDAVRFINNIIASV